MPTHEKLKEHWLLKLQEPKLYDVILLNDDFTSMDFVVEVLCEVFYKNIQDATSIMLNIHNTGQGVAGTYTYDIACSKVKKVTKLARSQAFPLRLEIREHI